MLPDPMEVQEFDEVSERGAYGSTGSKDIVAEIKRILRKE